MKQHKEATIRDPVNVLHLLFWLYADYQLLPCLPLITHFQRCCIFCFIINYHRAPLPLNSVQYFETSLEQQINIFLEYDQCKCIAGCYNFRAFNFCSGCYGAWWNLKVDNWYRYFPMIKIVNLIMILLSINSKPINISFDWTWYFLWTSLCLNSFHRLWTFLASPHYMLMMLMYWYRLLLMVV